MCAWQQHRPLDPPEGGDGDPAVPQDVIDHFSLMIGSTVYRAVSGLADEQRHRQDDAWPRDSDRSAKAAILGAERSRAAWTDLRDSGLASGTQIDAFQTNLTWLIDELARLFPNARQFRRPGIDG